MARPENLSAAGIAKKRRMAEYRAGLKRKGRPEASMVDVALAAASAAYADTVAQIEGDKGNFPVALRAILRGAVDVLVERGCSRREAFSMVRWRVSRESRKDLDDLVAVSRMPKRLGVSP